MIARWRQSNMMGASWMQSSFLPCLDNGDQNTPSNLSSCSQHHYLVSTTSSWQSKIKLPAQVSTGAARCERWLKEVLGYILLLIVEIHIVTLCMVTPRHLCVSACTLGEKLHNLKLSISITQMMQDTGRDLFLVWTIYKSRGINPKKYISNYSILCGRQTLLALLYSVLNQYFLNQKSKIFRDLQLGFVK